MKTILLGYLIAALVASCLAHPAVYPKTVLARNAQKPVPDILRFLPQLLTIFPSSLELVSPARLVADFLRIFHLLLLHLTPTFSWHVHVVYNIYDKVSIKNAMALRAQTIQHFAGYLGVRPTSLSPFS